ncbi:MAG: GH39 family glycosyl hydrolase [Bacilli bacterium]
MPILPDPFRTRCACIQNLDKFETYLRKCVERYKDRIKAWEIYNEPNLKSFWGDNPNPAEYAKLLERAYKAIKSIDPKLKVLYAGVSGVPIDYIEKTFEAGASKYFDIMNIHPYQHSNPEEKLPEEIKALKELMKKYGISEKPIWITEVGYSSAQECGVVCAEAFEAALEKLGLDYRKDGVCEVFDEKFGLGNNPIARAPEIMLPKAKKVRKISLEGIKNLDPQKNKILLLPVGEAFPKDYIKRPACIYRQRRHCNVY